MKWKVASCSFCGALAFLLSAPVQANVISFTTQFGDDGSGSFVYDDDNGGADRGFTSFVLDFSPALGASFASIGLDGGVATSALLGPGGSFAKEAFDILSGMPRSTGNAWLGLASGALTAPIAVLFGQVGSAGTLSFTDSTLLCTTPAVGGGEYSFCANVAGQVVSGQGSFSVVPEPATIALLGFGLAGLATARRRKQ